MPKRKSSASEESQVFSTGSQKVDTILHTLFTRVMSLEQWIRYTDKESALASTLITPTDSAGYINLLKTTVVGIPVDSRELEHPVSLSQASHQREVILRAVQRVCQRDGPGKNVLTFGFAPMSDNPKASVSTVPNIEYRYPNSGVNRLQHAIWKTLLSRIGDLIMGHLLEDTSIFIRVVKPAVYLQVAGEAVYQAWPYAAGSTLKAKPFPFKQDKVKPWTRKPARKRSLENVDCPGDARPTKRPRNNVDRSSCDVQELGRDKVRVVVNREAVSSTQVQGAVLQSDSSCGRGSKAAESVCTTSDPQEQELGNMKEPRHCPIPGGLLAQPNIPSGPGAATLELSEASELDQTKSVHIPTHNLEHPISHTHSDNVDYTGEKPNHQQQNTSSALAKLTSSISQENVHTLPQQGSRDIEETVSGKSKSSRKHKRKLTCGNSPALKKQKGSAELPRKKKRNRKRQKKVKRIPCSVHMHPYCYHKYVPRLSLLYGKNLREKFPASFSLDALEPTLDGAGQLMTDIFLNTDVGGNVADRTQLCPCQGRDSTDLDRHEREECEVSDDHLAKSQQKDLHHQLQTDGRDSDAYHSHVGHEQNDGAVAGVNVDKTVHQEGKKVSITGHNLMQSDQCDLTSVPVAVVSCGTSSGSSSGIPCGQVLPPGSFESTSSPGEYFTPFPPCSSQESGELNKTKSVASCGSVAMEAGGCLARQAQTTQDSDTSVTQQPIDSAPPKVQTSVVSLSGTPSSSCDADVSCTSSSVSSHSGSTVLCFRSGPGEVHSQPGVTVNSGNSVSEMAEVSSNVPNYTASGIHGQSQSDFDQITRYSRLQDHAIPCHASTASSSSPFSVHARTKLHCAGKADCSSPSVSAFPSSQPHIKTGDPTKLEEATQTQFEISCKATCTENHGDDVLLFEEDASIRGQKSDDMISGISLSPSVTAPKSDDMSGISVSPNVIPPSPLSSTSHAASVRLAPMKVTPRKINESTLPNDHFVSVHASQNAHSVVTPPDTGIRTSHPDNSQSYLPSTPSSRSAVHVSSDGTSVYEISEFSSRSRNSLMSESPAVAKDDAVKCAIPCHPSFYNPENYKDKVLASVSVTNHGVVPYVSADHLTLPAPSTSVEAACTGCDPDNKTRESESVSVTSVSSSHVGLFASGAKNHVLPLLQQFLQRHRQCPYKALLNHHCRSVFDAGSEKELKKPSHSRSCRSQRRTHGFPKTAISSSVYSHRKSLSFHNTSHLLEDVLSGSQVFAFLRAVLVKTVPEQLYGHPTNKTVFLKNVRSFLSLGKFEKMCLGQLMTGMKVKGCGWLQGITCQKEREHHMAQLLWWLFVYYVFHIVKTFFYTTDTTFFRNRVLFYRKRTWMKLQAKAMQDFRKSTRLKYISEAEVNNLLESKQSLGVSVLRFLPKTKSLRPIVNMSSKPKPETPQIKSINKQLLNLLQALTFEKNKDSHICGYSVFGLDDIYVNLRDFVLQRAAKADVRPLYFVKTDISKCFDSIQQQRLFDIISSMMLQDGEQTFVTRKYASVVMTGQRLKRAFHMDTSQLSTFLPDFFSFVRQKAAHSRLHDIILVDQVLCQQDDSMSLLDLLSCHLFKNIIKVGQHYYLQQTGVSQGSVVSSLLVSIYLAHLENTHLSVAKDELLIRMMDDYLFVTPHRNQAEHFLNVMLEGFPDYNCFTNVNKILTNFCFEHPAVGELQHTQPMEPFPWCGLLIDTTSLEVSVDYSRYSGLSVTDTVSFDASQNAGLTLRNKLFMCLKYKCHGIFFDPQMNGQEKILVNAYQVFLYLAQVFHSFVIKLPVSQRAANNTTFFCDTVKVIPQLLTSLVSRKLKHTKPGVVFPSKRQVLQWLSADAFLVKLHKYAGYKQLKKFLCRSKLSAQKKLSQQEVAALRVVHETGLTLDSAVTML